MTLFQTTKVLLLSALLAAPASVATAQFAAEATFTKTGGDARVSATVTQSNGKVIAVGDFDSAESTTRNNIARLTITGTLDSVFDPNANGPVNHALVQDDDSILIVGTFTAIGGVSRDGLARLNADGTLDTSFAPTFNNAVEGAALQYDGKILVCGSFTSVNSTTRNRIARLNSDGTLDTGFDPDADATVKFVTYRSDGKIIASGPFTTIGGGSASDMARLEANGTLDTSFTFTSYPNITSCQLIGADGSMLHTIFGGVNSQVYHLDSSGTLIGVYMSSPAGQPLTSLIGSADRFFASYTDGYGGGYYGYAFGSGYLSVPAVGAPHQLTQRANGSFLYSRWASGGIKVGHTSVTTTEKLVYLGGTTLRWTQTVNYPDLDLRTFDYTRFQLSTDGGSTWSDLGLGTAVSTNQVDLTGITLPGAGLIRVVGVVRGGTGGVSRSLTASKVISIAPEIDIATWGTSVPILDGDSTPSKAERTDFGNQAVSLTTSGDGTSFILTNPGGSALTISSISFSGAHAGDFYATVTAGFPLTVQAQGQNVFGLMFDATALGTRTATVTITCDDPDESSFEFELVGVGVEPELNVKGNGISIPNYNTPSISDNTDFGSLRINNTRTRTFTIENTSSLSPLTIYSIAQLAVPPFIPVNFTVSGISFPAVVPALSSTTFDVTFVPGTSVGTLNRSLFIRTDDADEGSFDLSVKGFGFEPEANLTGNSVNIADGDATPSAGDHSDFGSPSVGGSVVRTFTIQNTGTGFLNVTAINVSGHTSDFTVGGISLPAVVAGSGSTTFTVTYLPTVSGLRSATLTLVNDDANEASYDFAIQGTSSPEINVQGSGTSIVDGDTTPSLTDETDFGVAISSTEQVISTFTIQNLGSGPLDVSSISKSGTHNADYAISGLSLPASVPSGGAATFGVTFSPSAVGARTATITIANSDPNEGSYDFAIKGTGVQAGQLDGTFNPTASAHTVNAAAVQPDGRIIVVGAFTSIGGTAMDRVARINQDGTLDTSFADPNINGEVHCVALQADGEILIGGAFTSINGTARNRIARLNSDGSLDSYNPNSNGVVYSISVQSDGKAIVTGAFAATSPTASIGGQTRNRVARLDTSGAADSFNPNVSTASSNVYGSVTQADGKVIIYGTFTTVGGTTRNRIARVDSSGALDTGYNPNSASTINCAVLQPNGKLVVGGIFTTTIGGQTRTRLARLETNGSADTGFTATANAEVHGLSLQANGKIIVNGQLTLLNATGREYAGRLNDDGTFDSSFIDPNPSASGYIYGSTLEADGGLVVTGAFTTIGGTARMKIARLENNVSSETLAVTSSSRIEWLRGGAGPEARFVIFELSTDGGSTWSSLGSGTRISGGWEITGLSLPGTGQVRASAYTSSGRRNGSQGIVQSTVVY